MSRRPAAPLVVAYSATTATAFTGCSGGAGTLKSGGDVNPVSVPPKTTIAAPSGGTPLPAATLHVGSTGGFAPSGYLYVQTTAATAVVGYGGTTATAFTGCSGGSGTLKPGGDVNPVAVPPMTTIAGASFPVATLEVASTAGFPSSGLLYVETGSGLTQISYSGVTPVSFTGCSGGTGTVRPGGFVTGVNRLTPMVNASDNIAAPTPMLAGSHVYDFFEFTHAGGGMYVNTSAVDQFGLSLVLHVEGGAVAPVDTVGVKLQRDVVFSQYKTFTANDENYRKLLEVGNPVPRIYSPGDFLLYNPVQGLVATGQNVIASGTLQPGTHYYYAIAATIGQSELRLPVATVRCTPSSSGSIQVSWSAQPQPPTGWNLYRGTPSGNQLTWQLIHTASKTQPSFTDTGAAGTPRSPTFNGLAGYFDKAIEDFFTSTDSLDLSVVDNGFTYAFLGTRKAAPAWTGVPAGNQVIEFVCTDIQPGTGTPGLPLQSKLFVFKPFFCTNTANPENPEPPAWLFDVTSPPSVMLFLANGVFADNIGQAEALAGLPDQPAGLRQADYSTVVGAIEDMIDAALLRGIASRVKAVNWANAPGLIAAPAGLAASAGTAPGTLSAIPYYYVVTAFGAAGESLASNEAGLTPAGSRSVALSWSGVAGATGYNVYRGTAPGQESVLAGSATGTAFTDTGAASATGYPPAAYYAPGTTYDLYAKFLHQPEVSYGGLAYAAPFDDQGNQSSTIHVTGPTRLTLSFGTGTS